MACSTAHAIAGLAALTVLAGCAADVARVETPEPTPMGPPPAPAEVPVLLLEPARSYEARLEIVRRLQHAHPYPFAGTPAAWPDHREGIALQTRWQLESGRSVVDGPEGLGSWWPNVNWSLTVWQLQAVQERRGELDEIGIVVPDAGLVLPDDVADAWLAYYDAIDAARAEAESGALSPAAQSARARALQQLMWRAHVLAIRAALSRSTDELMRLPAGERRFAAAWGYTVVELLSIAEYPTDAITIQRMQRKLLPPRVVTEADLDLAQPSDLPQQQREILAAMDWVHAFEQRHDGFLARAWTELVSRPGFGDIGPFVLEQVVLQTDHVAEHLDNVAAWIADSAAQPNGEPLDETCEHRATREDGSFEVRCSPSNGPIESVLRLCVVAPGLREWNCRSCQEGPDRVESFVHLHCPDGPTDRAEGACTVTSSVAMHADRCAGP